MRRLSGFSLMEMMIVLLIVAIVAAASAPMINKKMMSSASKNESSPWVWTGQNNNIAFNLNGAENAKVTIGAINPPAGVKSILHLNGSLSLPSGCMLSSTGESVALTNKEDNGENSVVVGFGASAAKGSIAIGKGAKASHDGSVAIGAGVETSGPRQIMLGNSNTRVVIPGELYVTGNVYLAGGENSGLHARLFINNGVYNRIYELIGDTKFGGGWTVDIDKDEYISNETYDTLLKGQSDRRLKNVGKASTAGLEEIKKLEVFNYTFKKDKSKTPRVGVMAQDLQKIFPNAVTKGEDGFLMIRMEDMFYAMVNAVKELANKDESQAKKIQELEKQNKELMKRLEALEKNVNKKSK